MQTGAAYVDDLLRSPECFGCLFDASRCAAHRFQVDLGVPLIRRQIHLLRKTERADSNPPATRKAFARRARRLPQLRGTMALPGASRTARSNTASDRRKSAFVKTYRPALQASTAVGASCTEPCAPSNTAAYRLA